MVFSVRVDAGGGEMRAVEEMREEDDVRAMWDTSGPRE